MESITYSNIAQITGGKANTIEDFPVTGVETDSRRVQKGDMYVAIIGAKADGHDLLRMPPKQAPYALWCQSPYRLPSPF